MLYSTKNRLKAVQKFTKSIQVLSVNGDGLHFSDIQELVEVLKTGLQSDRQISLDNFLKVLSNHNDRHLIPNSEFQRKIDDKFGKMIQGMPRSDQVESLMLLCKALANSLSKIMKFYNSWFETNNDDVDHQIIPSNLEVKRSFGIFKYFESKYSMMNLTIFLMCYVITNIEFLKSLPLLKLMQSIKLLNNLSKPPVHRPLSFQILLAYASFN